MLWKLKSYLLKEGCPVEYRVHKYVLRIPYPAYIRPGKELILREAVGISHCTWFTAYLLIHIVTDKHIQCLVSPDH